MPHENRVIFKDIVTIHESVLDFRTGLNVQNSFTRKFKATLNAFVEVLCLYRYCLEAESKLTHSLDHRNCRYEAT